MSRFRHVSLIVANVFTNDNVNIHTSATSTSMLSGVEDEIEGGDEDGCDGELTVQGCVLRRNQEK